VAPKREAIKGRDCLVLERTRGVTDRWYIDPAPDRPILRYEVLSRGRPRVRIDLDYTSDGTGSRSLRSWHTRVWSGGDDEASRMAIGIVRDLEVGERPPAKQFELDFPRGTWVVDQVRGREYVIEDDGSERLVTREEMARRARSVDRLKGEPDEER
jgi:hypothetical protein